MKNLRCEYRINPLGIDVENPRLSWELPETEITAYQLQAASSINLLQNGEADLYDSGVVEYKRPFFALYQGAALRSLQRVFWRVRLRQFDGTWMAWSEVAWWENGLLKADDWHGCYIGGGKFFRRKFAVGKTVARARLAIVGLGYYQLYLDGKKVGDEMLAPAQTDYEKRVFYSIFDITQELNCGEHAIGVILGEGFFEQSKVLGRHGWGKEPYGKRRLLLELRIEYNDASTEYIYSDENFSVMDGALLDDNVYSGEIFDATIYDLSWALAKGSEVGWLPAKIMPDPQGVRRSHAVEPCRIVRIIQPVSSYKIGKLTIYDFGENIAGITEIRVRAKRGMKITVRYAEEIEFDKTLEPSSTGFFATHYVQTIGYITAGNGEVETYRPGFSYQGFRYAEVSDLSDVDEFAIEAQVLHTDFEFTGEFNCDQEYLNTVYRMAKRTILGNMQGVPTDCPAREKCGWLGDVGTMMDFADANFNLALTWTKFMEDIQTSAIDGLPTHIAPGLRKNRPACPAWATACVQIPYAMYVRYGDDRLIRRHWELLCAHIANVTSHATEMIVDYGYGDWCPPGRVVPVAVSTAVTTTLCYYHDVVLMSEMAGVIGRPEEAEYYKELSGKIQKAFIAKFFDEKRATFGSQTANAFALGVDMVPEEYRILVAASLAREVAEAGYHHTTGILGWKHLLKVLCSYGHVETAWKVLTQTSYPSIGRIIAQGATTMWENWEKEQVDNVWPRSRNHPMQCGFATVFQKAFAGINESKEGIGFEKVLITPCFPENLNMVEASLMTVRGQIISKWRKKENDILLEITLPGNTEGTLVIGMEQYPLAGGVTNKIIHHSTSSR